MLLRDTKLHSLQKVSPITWMLAGCTYPLLYINTQINKKLVINGNKSTVKVIMHNQLL